MFPGAPVTYNDLVNLEACGESIILESGVIESGFGRFD